MTLIFYKRIRIELILYYGYYAFYDSGLARDRERDSALEISGLKFRGILVIFSRVLHILS